MQKLLALLIVLTVASHASAQNFNNEFDGSGGGTSEQPTDVAGHAGGLSLDRTKGLAGPLSVSDWDSVIARPPFEVDGGLITCMIADGNDIYVAGDMRSMGTAKGQGVAKYTASKGSWSFLDYGPRGMVRSMKVHKGLLYVGGDFSQVGASSAPASAVAVWDGTSWSEVGGGLTGAVWALEFQGDTLYAGGQFNKASGSPANYLAMYTGTGLWKDAAGGTSSPVYSLLSRGDTLYVGGNFRAADGTDAWNIAMLHHGLWDVFGIGFDGSVYSMAWYDGKLTVAGSFFFAHDRSQTFYGLAQWDGTRWTNFGTDKIGMNAEGVVNGLYTTGDSLFILGDFTSIAGVQARGIAMLRNGAFTEVGGGVYGEGFAALQTSQGLMVGGRYSKVGATKSADNIARYDGTSWTTVGGVLGGYRTMVPEAVAASNNYVFFGGPFTRTGSIYTNHIAAWNKQTRTWESLGSGVDGNVYTLKVQGDKLIVGGDFHRAGSLPMMHIGIWNMTTKTWSAMGDGSTRYVTAITAQGTDVYASYFAALENGKYVNYLGRWDGTKWNRIPGAYEGHVEALEYTSGILYAGGSIVTLDGNAMANIAAYDGSAWTGVGNGMSNRVLALKADNSGLLYATGEFSKADGKTVQGITFWDGSNWQPMGSGLSDVGRALAFDGKSIYVAGWFADANAVRVNRLARWTGSTFEAVSGGTENSIDGLDIDKDGLYISGGFSSAGGIASYRLAALPTVKLGVASTPARSTSILAEIYPNPSTDRITAAISMRTTTSVMLELENSLGQTVRHVFSGQLTEGPHQLTVNVSNLAPGAYTLHLMGSGISEVSRVMVLK